MTAILTIAGLSWLQDKLAGAIPQQTFNGLVLGAGLDTPTDMDTVESLSERLPRVLRADDGYPKVADDDKRNTASGPEVYTWRFTAEATSEPWIASNLAVVEYAGGAIMPTSAVAVSAKQTIAQRYDERRVIFVNIQLGEDPRIVDVREEAVENRVQRLAGYSARVRKLGSSATGALADEDGIQSTVALGARVWTAAEILKVDGFHVTSTDVESFTVELQRLRASTGEWETFARRGKERQMVIFDSVVRNDQRWHHSGGYNVEHTFTPPRTMTEATYRLAYELRLCDSDVRRWTHTLVVR